ncbi:hypothetical protein, partial [Cobetia marina]|uniref:hypothetical protein n=2 Tax=Cobetia TaxID=204286 RepID=UPI001C2E2178
HVRVGHRQALILNRPCSLAAGAVLFVRRKNWRKRKAVSRKTCMEKWCERKAFPGCARRKSFAHHHAVMVLSLTENDVRSFFIPGLAKNLSLSLYCEGVFLYGLKRLVWSS